MNCSAEMAFFHSNFMLQNSHHEDDHNTSLPPNILPSCTPQEFHVASLLGKRSFNPNPFENNHQMGDHQDEALLSDDDGSQLGEKKRRLNIEQVKTLEKNFEQGNKLEPERKIQLARALGLQPRQIAIWFQNRRARWKTKQLEKDYEILKRQFDAVKGENEVLQTQNQKLQSEILALKTREPTESINLNKETEGSCSNRSTTENSSEIIIKLDNNISTTTTNPAIDSPLIPTTATRPLFLSSLRPNGPAHQFFQNSTRPDIHGPKSDQIVKEESSLCNVFCGMDDQTTGFWPWIEQNHYN